MSTKARSCRLISKNMRYLLEGKKEEKREEKKNYLGGREGSFIYTKGVARARVQLLKYFL